MVLPSADSDKPDYGAKEDEVAPIMIVSVDPGKPDRKPEGRRSCTDYESLDRFRKTRQQKRQNKKMKLQWLLAHLEQSSSQVRKNKTYTPYPE